MDEKIMLTYNQANLITIRNNLHHHAMETSDHQTKNTYHETMMKIDDLLTNIDRKLKEM